MNAQQHFALMCAAMISDEWVLRVQDEIDALPEEFVHEDDVHYIDTLEYAEDVADRDFWRSGQW